jgi:uncharacterized protein involved in exopolysaccharide biosynthesis
MPPDVPSESSRALTAAGYRPSAAERAGGRPRDVDWRPAESVLDEDGWVWATARRHGRLIVGLGLMLAVLTVGYGLSRPREYQAYASFTPRTTDIPKGGLGGLAAQFGVNVGGEPAQSPDFYGDLLVSRPVLGRLVGVPLSRVGGGQPLPPAVLEEELEPDGDTPAERREDAVRQLRRRVIIAKNQKTSVVTVAVRTRSPELSAAVAGRLLDLVNEFNQRTRQQKATDEQQFADERQRALRAELSRAEEELAAFRSSNRGFENSPELELREQRLERQLQTRQQVFTTVVQLYEQSRLDAVRDVPVISVIERPEIPVRPESRRLALKAAVALLLGGLLGFGVGFVRDVRDVRRGRPVGAETAGARVPRPLESAM